MDGTDGRSRLVAALEESLCRDADIEFAVAFGSQVSGDSHPSSDFDVAIKFADDLSSHERFQKRCFLSGALQQENAPFVDVSDIEELPVGVAADAVNGVIRCGDEQAFHQFDADVETAFEEQRDDIRRPQQDVIERIAEEGLHG
jgi:predicted nucleotidyltransferase